MSLLLLPKHIQDIQMLLRSLDWHALGKEVDDEAHAHLVIVGPVNSGKSTLFNHLHSRKISAVSAVPGTTQGVVEHSLGPFLLVDTPGYGEVWGVDRAAIANEAAAKADLILLLLDAAAGVRQADHDLYTKLRALDIPVVVALNKVDLVKPDLPWIMESVTALFGVSPLPISARTGAGVVEKLLPAVLKAQPAVALAMARSLPGVRKQLVRRIIARTAWTNALVSLEPFPGLDIPLLLATQTRMVLRIAAAYGQSMSASHAHELLTTMAGGLLTRYLGAQLAKFVPGLGWVVSAIFSAMGTWAIGQAALRYFESDGRLKGPDLKVLYKQMRQLAPLRFLQRKRTDSPDEPLSEDKEPGAEVI